MATTDDGYILEMHRIPYGKTNISLNINGKRPVVYVQHCLLCSSAEFVIPDPPKALGIQIRLIYPRLYDSSSRKINQFLKDLKFVFII